MDIMADGPKTMELTPTSERRDLSLAHPEDESLQGLKLSKAPGVSMSYEEEPAENKSRRGIFRVFAGLSPGTSTTDPLCKSLGDGITPTQIPHENEVRTRDDVAPHTSSSTNETGASLRNALPSNNRGFPSDMAFNMESVPSNAMVGLLFEQYQQTKELYSKQQASLDSLAKAIESIANKVGGGDHDNNSQDLQDSDYSEHSGVVSSDDECSEVSAKSGKRKMTETTTEICSKRLKKLKAVEAQFKSDEELGTNVHDVVASTINTGLSEQMDPKSTVVQDLLSKYKRPANCEYLEVPKVNKLLWTNKQTGKELKEADKGYQRMQNYITKGMIPLINIMNKTLTMESEEAEELFDWSLDALNLFTYAHRDLSAQRRKALLPAISSKYATLCSNSEKITSPTHLFGEDKDLEKRLREIDESQKLSKSLTVLSSGKQKQENKSSWRQKDYGKNASSSSKDFLPRRALTHQNYQQKRSKKGDQGQRKFQRNQKH